VLCVLVEFYVLTPLKKGGIFTPHANVVE